MSTIARPTRRSVLIVGATVPVLAACSASLTPREDFSDPVVRESLGDELALIALYTAAASARPDLSDLFTVIAAQHREHADALSAFLTGDATLVPTPTPTVGSDVLTSLRDAERRAVALRSGACTRADGSDVASLLCLISASEAQHVTTLAAVS